MQFLSLSEQLTRISQCLFGLVGHREQLWMINVCKVESMPEVGWRGPSCCAGLGQVWRSAQRAGVGRGGGDALGQPSPRGADWRTPGLPLVPACLGGRGWLPLIGQRSSSR